MAPTRTIEAAPLPARFARGWHCLGLAADYRDGKTHPINAFGSRLVAFMGEDGVVRILDAYCLHMGMDLNRGTVRRNSIQCAFHNWSWGGDGVCNAIPYTKKIPPSARIKSWPTCEQNKLLFVWNDPEDGMPSDDVAIPRIEACFSDEWTDWTIEKWTVRANCREVIDNVSDIPHFAPIHGVPLAFYANIFEGHKATQIMVGQRPSMEGGLTTCATYFGPAYQITDLRAGLGNLTIDSILLNCHVPITAESFELSLGMLVRKNPEFSEEQNQQTAKTFFGFTRIGFQQDMDVWQNKVRIDNPLLVDGDGPIHRLRQWYQQFYLDRADIAPAMRERFVLEVNPARLDPAPPVHHVLEE
jgi:3-ketosteroid 9alpha-monooxygenase subunit A